jgi:hypothetical protein
MTQITLDPELAKRLHDLTEAVEPCDPSGGVLGRFVPAMDPDPWEPVSPDISEDELERRCRTDAKRHSTVEVLSHLERL